MLLRRNYDSIVKHVLMVEEKAEESVKKRSDFRLGVEGWSTDLKGEAELCDDTPPPSKKKLLISFSLPTSWRSRTSKCD